PRDDDVLGGRGGTHDSEQRAAREVLLDPRVLQQQLQVGVEDAGGVVGPLDVAADPEQRLGDAREHQASPPARVCCCCSCCGCWPCAVSCGLVSSGTPVTGCAAGGSAATVVRRRPLPSTQVSFEPPPCEELTTSWPSASATRVSPPGSTHTFSPSLTAKGRRSTCRGRSESPASVGTVDSCTAGCAIQPRGSARSRVRAASSSSRLAAGPMMMPLPPEPSTGLTTSSGSRSSTSASASGSSSRHVSTLARIGSSPR